MTAKPYVSSSAAGPSGFRGSSTRPHCTSSPATVEDRDLSYLSALNDATGVKDGKLRLQVMISELEHAGYESAARCLGDDLDALVVHLRYPLRHRECWRSTNLLERSLGERAGGPR